MVADSESRDNEGLNATTSTNLAQIVDYETEIMDWFRTEISEFEKSNFNHFHAEFMECSKAYFDEICNLLDDPSMVRATLEKFIQSNSSKEQEDRWLTQNYERENKFTSFATEKDGNWRGLVGKRLNELKQRGLDSDWTAYQLQSQLAETQKECKSLAGEISQMKAEHEQAIQERTKLIEEHLQAKIDELEENWEPRERELIEQKDEAERSRQMAETDLEKERKHGEFLMRECKQMEALCGEINQNLEDIKAQKEEADDALTAKESQVSELEEQIQQQNMRIDNLNIECAQTKKRRRMSGISESLGVQPGGHASDSKSNDSWGSSTTSPVAISRLMENATGSPDDNVYNEYLYPILRQIAHYRASRGFVPYHMLSDAVEEKEAVLGAIGAILSHFDHGRSTPSSKLNLRQTLKDAQLWLVDEGVRLVGSDHDRKIREDLTKRNMDKIFEAFDEEYAWRENQAKEELHGYETLKKELDEARDNFEQVKTQLDEYRHPSVKEFNTQHEKLIAEVERLEVENKELKSQASIAEKEKLIETQLQEEIKDLKNTVIALQTKEPEIENQTPDYDQILRNKEEEIEKKTLEIQAWEGDHYNYKTKFEKELEKSLEQVSLIRERDEKLQEKENIASEQNTEIKKLKTEIGGLQKALEQNREKLNMVNSQLSNAEQSYQQNNNFLSTQYQRTLKQIAKLKEELRKCSDTPRSDEFKCATCEKLGDDATETGQIALDELKSISTKLGGIIKDVDRQNLIYFPDTSNAGYDTELLREIDRNNYERSLWQGSLDREREKVEDLERQLRPPCQDNDPSAIDPFAELPIAYRAKIYQLQRQKQELEEKIQSGIKVEEDLLEALNIGRMLLNFYRKIQQVLEKYREDKNKLVKAPTMHNPCFMIDMDIYLKDDLSKLQKQLLELLRELPQAPEQDKPARQRQRILLEREVEKYQCILDEIQLHSVLADEVMVISEIYNLDPEARLVQKLLEEHPEHAEPFHDQDLDKDSQTRPKVVAVVQAPTQLPWNWPLCFMLAATALFILGFIAQLKQKERWSVANDFSRALWVNTENRCMSFTLTHLIFFFLMNIRILYKGKTKVKGDF